jgi:hypothetical protein
MKRILLTGMSGMSGTGKSTVIAAPDALGYKAVDSDYGWCTTTADGEQLWHHRRVSRLLSTEDADVAVLRWMRLEPGQIPAPHRPRRAAVRYAQGDARAVAQPHEQSAWKREDYCDRVLDDHRNVEPLLRSAATVRLALPATSMTWSPTSFALPAERLRPADQRERCQCESSRR